jgi:circadian clock protein KaiB
MKKLNTMSRKKSSPVKFRDDALNGNEKYVLQLFVAGILPNSLRAISNIQSICEKHIQGRYDLEIIDIYQQPALALAEEIIAIPLLIKRTPHPQERMIGDLSDVDVVLRTLGLF